MSGIQSLQRFSPYLPGNQALLMPKLKYRYKVTMTNFGKGGSELTEFTKQIKTCGRPKPDFDTVVLDTYNSKVNILGKPKWNPIDVVVRDDAVNNVRKIVGEQLQKQFDFFEQASAAAAGDYKFETIIYMYDGGNGAFAPKTLEVWSLYGCMLTSVGYGDLDYASNDTIDLTLSITFDNALQHDGSDSTLLGVGMNVGRAAGQSVATSVGAATGATGTS